MVDHLLRRKDLLVEHKPACPVEGSMLHHQAEYPHLTWAELPWIHRQRLGTTFTQRKRAAAPHIYSRCATSCPNFWIYV